MNALKKTIVFILAIGALALFTACGGGEPEAPPKPDPVSITFVGTDDFAWDPGTVTVKTGQEVNVTLDNQGALEHNWILASKNVDVATASDADALYGANVGYVPGGQSADLTFTAPGPGEYLFICTVAGHAGGGMVGTLVVE